MDILVIVRSEGVEPKFTIALQLLYNFAVSNPPVYVHILTVAILYSFYFVPIFGFLSLGFLLLGVILLWSDESFVIPPDYTAV